ncbi:MAG TPA: DNA translocase FtsK [Spirochaeta sp.]|nr:DNA translocase FtsK [Spirochaeta sp.]
MSSEKKIEAAGLIAMPAAERGEAPEEATEADAHIEVNDESEHSFEPVPLEWESDTAGLSNDDADEPEILETAEALGEDPEIEELPLNEAGEDQYEPGIEPLDLDPGLGSLEDSEDNTGAAEYAELESEPVDVPIPEPVRMGDENYPDAPVRGDEEEMSRAAQAVWADAEDLGFGDVLPQNIRTEDERLVGPEDEETEVEEDFSTDLRLDIEAGRPSLEIPEFIDVPVPEVEAAEVPVEQPEDESPAELIEELEELETESSVEFIPEDESPAELMEEDVEAPKVSELVESAVDIDSILSAPVEPAVPSPKKKTRIRSRKYNVPVDDLLQHYGDDSYWIVDDETRAAAEVLRETLEEFRIAAEVTGISRGPVVTMFEILPAPGVKLSKIVNLADNIALRLAASRVRIVAPIPGKHAVGIEVPNKNRAIVSFKEILEAEDLKKSRMSIPVVLGKDISGGSRIIDLVQTPHLLIAGATGSGKSVCVNSLICSVLYSKSPEDVKMILIDPKIVELKMYNDIPHLLTPVITEPKRAFQALQYAMCEMERRYTLLNSLGVRDVKAYNRKVRDARIATDTLPYIVIIVDEFADLLATTGKELENVISRLAAMSRAIGIHLVLATQRPSVDVITGLIKANIPSRIAFMVASKTDSRIILDSMGADKLLGKGDMLFTSAWDPNPVRIQGAFLSDDEVERVTDHVKTLGEPDYIDDEIFITEDESGEFELESPGAGDPLMESAVQIVIDAGKASASYLQRRLKIGYNRAARLVEEMEDRGIVGPANGSKPREIIHIPDRV